MKLGEINEATTNLSRIAEKKFPAKISYAIAKNVELLKKEYQDLEQQRVKLCEMYADKDEEGKPIVEDGKFSFQEREQQKFQMEYEDLLKEEAVLDFHMVDAVELEKCDLNERYDVPTAEDYMSMNFMLK